mgnify:CR=1 FL=1
MVGLWHALEYALLPGVVVVLRLLAAVAVIGLPLHLLVRRRIQSRGRFIKQTGGRGQYGHVVIEMEPGEPGSGFEFVNKIVGGVIPSKFVPAVDKGVREALDRGILAGYPVVDVEVECYDGSYHAVDSSEQAFKVAGSMAFQKVARDARPIILEPILEVEVRTPEEFMGEVIGDLNRRRGKVVRMEPRAGFQVVTVHVPLAEMFGYATSLRSATQGRATYSMEFEKYAEAPKAVADAVISSKTGM